MLGENNILFPWSSDMVYVGDSILSMNIQTKQVDVGDFNRILWDISYFLNRMVGNIFIVKLSGDFMVGILHLVKDPVKRVVHEPDASMTKGQ